MILQLIREKESIFINTILMKERKFEDIIGKRGPVNLSQCIFVIILINIFSAPLRIISASATGSPWPLLRRGNFPIRNGSVGTRALIVREKGRMDDEIDIPLPMDKLSLESLYEASDSRTLNRRKIFVVLVSTGSFNPPTYMHLRMFELAKDALQAEGYIVIGGYMSPVNDAYKKKDLLSAKNRIQLCELACKSSPFVMIDPWEAKQSSYQRTLTVLCRIQGSLCKSGLLCKEALKVMLLSGSDLLESFCIPGVWIPDQVMTICRDFGVICIRRDGKDNAEIVANNKVLAAYKNNIISVDEIVPNQISSSKLRECIRRGLSVKYLTSDEVIDYIREHKLYMQPTDG